MGFNIRRSTHCWCRVVAALLVLKLPVQLIAGGAATAAGPEHGKENCTRHEIRRSLAAAFEAFETADPVCCQSRRPFVTLSYAQSLDGCIAYERGRAAPLSCASSMALTHELRAMHDCILVGMGTAAADNPRLTVRLGSLCSPVMSGPRPVILAPVRPRFHLADLDLRALRMQRPLVLTPDAEGFKHRFGLEKRNELAHAADEQSLCEVVECRGDPDHAHRCDLHDCLRILREMGYKRLMVEGGAEVISSFLQQSQELLDVAVITVAPCMLDGHKAVKLKQQKVGGRTRGVIVFDTLRSWRLGRDHIFMSRPTVKERLW